MAYTITTYRRGHLLLIEGLQCEVYISPIDSEKQQNSQETSDYSILFLVAKQL